MSRNHVAVVAQDGRAGCWLTLLRDYSAAWSVVSSSGASLEGVMAGALGVLKDRQDADFSFTSRGLTDIVAQPLIEDEASLPSAARGASLTIFCPEYPKGIGDGTLWAACWRDPTGSLSSAGAAGRFRLVSLEEQIMGWFRREDFRSFAPASVMERFSTQPVPRPGFARELLIRRDWSARRLAVDAFPDLEQFEENRARLMETERMYEQARHAKSEKGKKERTEQIQEIDRRMLDPNLTPEERAVLAEARKAQFGLPWGNRVDTGAGSGGSPTGQ
jgi:hypothetical protein